MTSDQEVLLEDIMTELRSRLKTTHRGVAWVEDFVSRHDRTRKDDMIRTFQQIVDRMLTLTGAVRGKLEEAQLARRRGDRHAAAFAVLEADGYINELDSLKSDLRRAVITQD